MLQECLFFTLNNSVVMSKMLRECLLRENFKLPCHVLPCLKILFHVFCQNDNIHCTFEEKKLME